MAGDSRPRLREIVGGYDIRRWPIHVPRGREESLAGWLARVGARYGITPGGVLDELGITVRPQRQVRLAALLTEHADEVEARLGLPEPGQAAFISTVGAAMHHQDGLYRQRHARRRRGPRLLGSRFCPACLAESPHWRDVWTHPLTVCCVRHHIVLLTRCPRCGDEPFRYPTWLTFDGDPMTCTGFPPHWDNHEQRYRPRCLAWFQQATAAPAEPGLLQAQQWLTHLATAAHADAATETGSETATEPATEAASGCSTQAAHDCAGQVPGPRTPLVIAAGVEVRAEVVYEAATEMIHTVAAAHTPRIRTSVEDAEITGYAVRVAHDILTQPDLDRAGQRALRLNALGENGALVPLGPRGTVGRRYRNPLVTGLGLSRFRGRITLGVELTLRMGDAIPGYPAEWTTTTTSSTPALGPAQRRNLLTPLPPLPLAWIPQQLWPGALGDLEDDPLFGLDTPTGRAFAAVALARYGSDRPWRVVATNLGLPAGGAGVGARIWRNIDRGGRWRDYITSLARLYHQLHDNPPPIDYERRRLTADPAAITEAAHAELRQHQTRNPGYQPPARGVGLALATLAWDTYTGGSHTLAPQPFGPPVQPPQPRPAGRQPSRQLGRQPSRQPVSLDALVSEVVEQVDPAVRHREPLTWRPP